MLYEITFKMGADGETETIIVEAMNETEAISRLGRYRGKRAVKRIKDISVIGFAEDSNPYHEFMVQR
jgi:hypothetical protein